MPRRSVPSVLIEPSPPIVNLFARAEEGIQRADWKFAIDSLQRIVDDPKGSLVARTEGDDESVVLYETASRRATRRIASLPPDGLHAYQLLYNGKARRLFEMGRTAHDPAPLRTIVHRFVVSDYGDDAVDLLASWALDEGRPGETVALLTAFMDLNIRHDVPDALIVSKLATAYAMLGRLNEAEAVLETALPDLPSETASERSRGLKPAAQTNLDLPAAPSRLQIGLTSDVLTGFVPRDFHDGVKATRWPIAGGVVGRQGRQPPVWPTLIEHVPWRFDVDGVASDTWRRVFDDDPDAPLWLPVKQPVASNQRLFVRTPHGCLALEMADLTPAWKARDPASHPAVSVAPASRRGTAGGGRSLRQPVPDFEDYVTGAISVQAGLVFTVARDGQVPYTQASRDPGGPATTPLPPPAPSVVSPPAGMQPPASGTRLVAYDQATGVLRWQRGRTIDPSDPLGNVDFRSVPIEVQGSLWVPFLRQSDLYVAVLDPADGALRRAILLCSTNDPRFAARLSLPPTALDGVVYVPSGHGVLFAIDAHNYHVRWASQYSRHGPFVRNARLSGRGWQPCAPIVSGGLVLLAPVEVDELLALSASNGELRWSRPCENCSYLIAADHRRVWVGGRRITCLSTSDGQELWSVDLPSAPTGRAILSGDKILAPLLDGLHSLDASSGATGTFASSVARREPLGNLLCLDASMFVVNPSSVRKFPDLDQSYPLLADAYRADPTDPGVGLRLAWLTFLRGEPRAALALLDGLEKAAIEAEPRLRRQIAHLRVEALLMMADRAAEDPARQAEALALLEQARDTARRPTDRLRCRLARATRLTEMGQYADAYRRLWDLGLSDEADQVVPRAEFVDELARIDIADRLREIEPHLTPPERQSLRTDRAEQIEEAANRLMGADVDCTSEALTAASRLKAIADLEPQGPIRQRALLELAAFHRRYERYEPAEQFIRASARVGADASLTSASLVELARLYSDAGMSGVESSVALLASLEAIRSLPGGGVDGRTLANVLGNDDPLDGYESLHDWIIALQATVSDATRDAYRWGTSKAPFQFTGALAWSLTWDPREPPLQLVGFGQHRLPALSNRVLLHGPGDVVTCYHARTGELLWQAELRLPGRLVDGSASNSLVGLDVRRRAVADGETAVFSGDDGLFAIGLLTGRRLWVRPYELSGEPDAPLNRDDRMDAEAGWLAAVLKAGRLTMMRIEDGATIWERDLRDEPVAHVRIVADRIVTMDARLERVNLLDRTTGAWVQRVLFEQPDPESNPVDLVLTGGVLAGPVSNADTESVVGIDVVSGAKLWQLRVDKPIVQIFKASEGYIGVGLLGGDVRIVHAASGDPLPPWRIAGTQKVVGAALVDGTLLVQFAATRKGSFFRQLAGLDVATGRELWRRDDVMSFRRTGPSLPVFSGRVPVLVIPAEGPKRKRKMYLTLIDIRTGEDVGPHVPPGPVGNARVRGDFEVFRVGGVFVMVMDAAIHALKIEPASNEVDRG